MLNKAFSALLAMLFVTLFSTLVSAQTFRLELEEPVDGARATGVSNIRGWAVADAGIDRIEIFIDGEYVFDIPYGGERVDVGDAFPDVLGSDESGFGLTFNYGNLGAGSHTLSARAIALDGRELEQTANFRVVAFPTAFLPEAEKPSLTDIEVEVDEDDDKIELKGVLQGGETYDIELSWSTASQSFQIVGLDRNALPSGCAEELGERDVPVGITLSKGLTRNVRVANDRIQTGSSFEFSLVNGGSIPISVEELEFEDENGVLQTTPGRDLPALSGGVLDAQQAVALSFTTPDQGALGEIDVEVVLSLDSECFVIDDELFDAENSLAPTAYTTTASGLQYFFVEEGDGPRPTATQTVRAHYIGTLEDGTVFDSSYARGEPAVFEVNRLIEGFSEALRLMNEGATVSVRIPPELGYGSSRVGVIPADSTLLFEITLLDVL